MTISIRPTKATDPRIRDMLRTPDEKREDEKAEERKSDDAFDRTGKGRYKIELFLGRGRSGFKPYPGMLTFWESGTHFHGGGDVRIYLCPDPCRAPIGSAHHKYGMAICQKCGVARKSEETVGEVLARNTTANWAHLLTTYFRRFGGNCDIYLKYSEGDLRGASAIEQDTQRHGGELLQKAEEVQLVIYPLRNILKDSQYTDVEKCFLSFLKT